MHNKSSSLILLDTSSNAVACEHSGTMTSGMMNVTLLFPVNTLVGVLVHCLVIYLVQPSFLIPINELTNCAMSLLQVPVTGFSGQPCRLWRVDHFTFDELTTSHLYRASDYLRFNFYCVRDSSGFILTLSPAYFFQ